MSQVSPGYHGRMTASQGRKAQSENPWEHRRRNSEQSSKQYTSCNAGNTGNTVTPQEGFPGGSDGKEPPAKQETQVQPLGQEDLLEKGMATHSSILAWEIPRTKEPGGPRSMESDRLSTCITSLFWKCKAGLLLESVIQHSNKVKEKNHSISIDAEKASDHTRHWFLKNIPPWTVSGQHVLSLEMGIRDCPTADTTLSGSS